MNRSQTAPGWLRRIGLGLAGTLVGLILLIATALLVARFVFNDGKLANMVADAANKQMQGTFEIENIHWELFPIHAEIRGVRITPRESKAAVRLPEVRASLGFWALFRGTLAINDVEIVDPRINVVQRSAKSPILLATAFEPKEPKPASEEKPGQGVPLRIEVNHFSLENGRIAVNMPDLHVHVRDLQFRDTNIWLQDTRMGATSDLGLGIKVRSGTQPPIALQNLHIHVDEAAFDTDPANTHGSLEELLAETTGFKLQVGGDAKMADNALQNVDGRVELNVDETFAVLKSLMPPHLFKRLHGGAVVHAKVQGGMKQQHFAVDVEGQKLSFADVDFKDLHLDGTYKAPELNIGALNITMAGAKVLTQGSAIIAADANTLLGVHSVNLKADDLPLRTLLTPYVKQAAGLPEKLSMKVQAQGKSLWPLGTALQVQFVARGIPAAQLPGVPDPLELSGRLVLRPSAVDLDPLRFVGDGAELSLQGTMPLKPDGIVEIFTHLVHVTPGRTLKRLNSPLGARDIDLKVRMAGRLNNPTLRGELRVRDLRTAGGAPMQVNVPFNFASWQLLIKKAQVAFAHGRVLLSGRMRLHDGQGNTLQDPSVAAQVKVENVVLSDVTPLLQGTAQGDITIGGSTAQPTGHASLAVDQLSIQKAHFKRASLTLQADRRGATLTEFDLVPTEGGAFTARGRAVWKDHQIEATVQAVDVALNALAALANLGVRLDGALQAEATASGTWDAPQVHAKARLNDVAIDGTPLGNVTALANGSLEAATLDVIASGDTAALQAHAQLQPRLETVAATLQGRIDLAAVGQVARLPMSVAGALHLDLAAQGPWAEPQVTGGLHGEGLKVRGNALGDGSLALALETPQPGVYRGNLRIPDFAAAQAQINISHLQVEAQLSFTQVQARQFVEALSDNDTNVTATGTAMLHYAGAPETTQAELTLSQFTVEAAAENLTLQGPTLIRLQNEQLTLAPLQLRGKAGHIDAQGRIDSLLHTPVATDVRLDGQLDLSLLTQWVPALAHASGTLALVLAAQGPLTAPELHGEVRADSPIALRLRGAPLGEVHLNRLALQVSPDKVVVGALQGSVGTGIFEGSGEVALRNFVPHGYSLHMQGSDIPLRTAELILEANVALDAQGEGLMPKLHGKVDITRGRYAKEFQIKDFYFVATQPHIDAPLEARAPMLNDLLLDITASTSNRVAVKVDTGVFAVQTELDAALHITGTALRPRVDGKISAEQGTLRFPSAQLQISQAVLDFVPTATGKLGATVTLTAEGEVTPSGSANSPPPNPVDVTMELDGTLDKMALDLRANPTLTRLEVLALLATGHANLMDLTEGGGDSSDSSKRDAAMAFAGSQASGPLAHFAQEQIERRLNLKVELGAEITQDDVRLTAAKRINPRLRLEGAYQRGLASDSTSITTRAQLSLTDRLSLEGGATRDLSAGAASRPDSDVTQNSLQLKWRLMGP